MAHKTLRDLRLRRHGKRTRELQLEFNLSWAMQSSCLAQTCKVQCLASSVAAQIAPDDLLNTSSFIGE